ncbi:MAG: carbohydrate binding domain-containing protein, partial [Candidatus Methanoperedens sp.]|nr:carbohydrate binding domain-containing protein [Candidatus Methanoperedens sp.]
SQAALTVSRTVNLIQNPGFESGTTPWIASPTANVTYSRVTPGSEGTYAARLYIKTIGRNMQLYQKAISLEPNTRYRLSFAAYSTGGHDISVKLIKPVSPYTNYGLNQVYNLSTTWQVFSTEFTTTGFTSNVTDGSLQFYLNPYAAKLDSFYIDSVVLEKVIVSPEVVSKSPTGTNVSVGSTITLNFSTAMNQASVQSAFSISPTRAGTFRWNG